MQTLIISYVGGMFGEFTASIIEEGSDKFISSKSIETTKENRFLYPNYLSPINFDCKTFPKHQEWPIDNQQINQLQTCYGDKWICLPTHWYSNQIQQSNLPCQGIAMFSANLSIIKLAYSLFWIKSHVVANSPWPSRKEELQLMINTGHKYARELLELNSEGNYQNWKFLAYRHNMLDNGKLDLHYYMNQHFNFYKKHNFLVRAASSDWFKFDIGNAIHGNQKNLPLLEEHLEITLNKERIAKYSAKNLEIIKDKLGFTLNNISSPNWLDVLYEYCRSEMQD
jgi:hypothetical protein